MSFKTKVISEFECLCLGIVVLIGLVHLSCNQIVGLVNTALFSEDEFEQVVLGAGEKRDLLCCGRVIELGSSYKQDRKGLFFASSSLIPSPSCEWL